MTCFVGIRSIPASGESSHARELIHLQVNHRMVLVSGFSFCGSAAAIVGRVRHGHPLRNKLSGYKEHDTGFEMHQAMREEGLEIRIVVRQQSVRARTTG
jgi:hypothetical protein